MSFKKLIVGAALSISSLAAAAPPHRAVPVAPPPAPVVVRYQNQNQAHGDRFDVARGRALLAELDANRRVMRPRFDLDARIAAFIRDELNESRIDSRTDFGRREQRVERDSTRRLTQLINQFSRVQGRHDRYAMMEKRRVLVAAIDIAERDLNGRPMRNGRR